MLPRKLASRLKLWWILHLRYGGNRTHAGNKPTSHTVCDLNHSTNLVYTIGTECSHHMWWEQWVPIVYTRLVEWLRSQTVWDVMGTFGTIVCTRLVEWLRSQTVWDGGLLGTECSHHMWWEHSVPIVYTRLVEWVRSQTVWDGGLLGGEWSHHMWWEHSVPIVYIRLVEWVRSQTVWDGGLLGTECSHRMWWEHSVPIVYTRLVEWLRSQTVWDGVCSRVGSIPSLSQMQNSSPTEVLLQLNTLALVHQKASVPIVSSLPILSSHMTWYVGFWLLGQDVVRSLKKNSHKTQHRSPSVLVISIEPGSPLVVLKMSVRSLSLWRNRFERDRN